MTRPFLSVIIPAFNEAERLPLTLIDVDRYLKSRDYSYEILVIDDGSTDNTAKIVDKFAPLIKKLKLIKNSGNRGKGSAVKIGMLAAKGDLRLAMDADNSVPLSEFNKMIPYFKKRGCDIVIASRGFKATKISPSPPFAKTLSDLGVNFFIRILFKSKIKDFFLGFHCFSAESAEKIFSAIKMNKNSFAQEALLLGEKLGFNIKEIPISGSYSARPKSVLNNYLQIILETVKIRWWLKKGKYKGFV